MSIFFFCFKNCAQAADVFEECVKQKKTGQDLWIYLHLRSDSFTSPEWDVFSSAGYNKNAAIVLHFLHFAFRFPKTDSAVSDFSLFPLSTIFHPLCLIGWLTAGFAAPPPCWNNSSLLALHPSIHQAFDSTASCHPSPTNFSIGKFAVTAVQNYRLYCC